MLAHKVVKFIERMALESVLRPLPFSVTGLFGAFWRRPLGGRTLLLHLFSLRDLSFNSDGFLTFGPFVTAGERIG